MGYSQYGNQWNFRKMDCSLRNRSYTLSLKPQALHTSKETCYNQPLMRFGLINSISIETKINKIKNNNRSLWEHVSSNPNTHVREWLGQFKTHQEKLSALDVVERIKLYSLNEVRSKLINAHEWLVSQPGFNLEKTKFVPLGTSKSGSIISCLYRQSNALPTVAFSDWSDIKQPLGNVKHQPVDTLVILDDFIGTGKEAQYWLRKSSEEKNLLKEELNKYKNIYLISVAGYSHGKQHLETTFPKLKIHFVDHHYKFYTECNHFSKSKKARINELMTNYNKFVYPQDKYGKKATPLGFNDGQSLVCFFYNTPSNVPPIIWSEENGWKPLIKRYHSLRDFEEYNRFNEKKRLNITS